MDEPDGLTVLDALPGRLLALDLEDLPGVGGRVRARLRRAGISVLPESACKFAHVLGERQGKTRPAARAAIPTADGAGGSSPGAGEVREGKRHG